MNSPTFILDPATLTLTLAELDGAISPNRPWLPATGQNGVYQQRFLKYCGSLRPWRQYHDLPNGLKAKVSEASEELNDFSERCGGDRCFISVEPGAMSMMMVIDITVEWPEDVTRTKIFRWNGHEHVGYHGVEVPLTHERAIEFKRVANYPHPLVKMPVGDGLWLWLMMVPKPADEFAMIELAKHIIALSESTAFPCEYDTVRFPAIAIDHLQSLGWLFELSKGGDPRIEEAFQWTRLALKPEGERELSFTPGNLTFDQPFLGFLSRGDFRGPISVFYSEPNSWPVSKGGLATLEQ